MTPTPSWEETAQSLPHDIPDDAYNAIRDNYFHQVVAPQVLQSGYGLETARQQFMDKTERADKSSMPRTAVVAKQALQSLAAPITGLMSAFGDKAAERAQVDIERGTEHSVIEAQRQGIDPRPYQYAGDMLGVTPYFAAGMGVAGPLAEAAGASEALAGLGPVEKAVRSSAIGIIQGAYNAASAPNGQRAASALEGVAAGTAIAAGFEGVGSLWSALRGAHGLSTDEAKAVEAVAKGVGSQGQAGLAEKSLLDTTGLDESIKSYVSGQAQAAAKQGIPKDVLVDPPLGKSGQPARVKIQMTGADGKVYNLGGAVGLPVDQLDALIPRVAQHLQAGGSISAVGGSPDAVNYTMRALEVANAGSFDLDIPVRPLVPDFPLSPKAMKKVPNDTIPGVEPPTPEQAQSARASYKPLQDKLGTSWISPEGEVHDSTGVEHEESIGDHLDIPEDNLHPIPEALKRGWVRHDGDSFEIGKLTQSNLVQAWEQASAAARAKGSGLVHIDVGGRSLSVPLDDAGEFLANPKKYAQRQARSSFRSPVDDVINSRDSVYHATKVTALESILHDGKIFPSGAGSSSSIAAAQKLVDSGVIAPEHAEAFMANWSNPNPESGSGVSVSRVPRVASKAEKAITLVLDPDKVPTSRPFTETGFAKTRIGPPKENSGARNEQFEFENRTYGEPISLKALKGVLIDLQAMGVDSNGASPELHPDVVHITSQLEAAGIPYKIFDSGAEIHSYRAGLRKLPPDQRWAVNQSDIPEFDKYAQVPYGVIDKSTGEVFPDLASAQAGPRFKETPLVKRFVGNSETVGPFPMPEGLSIDPGPWDSKPTLHFASDVDKGTIFHENLHGHFGALDMHDDVMRIMHDDTANQIYNSGFSPVAKDLYGTDPFIWAEEIYAHGADAIRTSNEEKINSFAEADTDKPTFLNWMTEKSKEILDVAAEQQDSLHKRTLERRVNSVISRATKSVDDLSKIYSQSPSEIGFRNGMYSVSDGSTTNFYSDRGDVISHLEPAGEPLNAPELVDTSLLPERVARYAKAVAGPRDGKPPLTTEPPNPELSDGPKRAQGGLQLLSRFFRPWSDWLATVSQKNDWPELYDAFAPFDHAQVEYNNFTRPYVEHLKTLLQAYPEARQKDFFHWFAGDDTTKRFVEQQSRFTQKELEDLARVQSDVLDPLAGEYGVSLNKYFTDILPKIRTMGSVEKAFPRDVKTKDGFLVAKLRTGAIDPKEENLLWLTANYLKFGAQEKFINPSLRAAQELVNEKLPDGTPRAGALQALLQRHLDYVKGTPDYTQEIVNGAITGVVDLINQGLSKVNSKLPEGAQLPQIKGLSNDPLGKFILFSYAGALALKPATIIRDALQLFITTLPIAGKYTFTGINKAFGAIRNPDEAERLWSTARKYGALIERNDLSSLYATEDPTSQLHHGGIEGRAESVATWALKSIQLTHNSNRLAAFWGHTEQVLDAVNKLHATGDQKAFVKESGLWFMNPEMRNSFLQEAPNLTSGEAIQDYAHRAAKELTELSQWNFKRGANPGLYEYQLGRLFGQFGTWPLNYIEYARRFATSGDPSAAREGLTRLTLAHGAILATGQMYGVDTSGWVFTSPMAYQGGPLFTAMTNIPGSFSAGKEGEDARRELRQMIFPGMVPGDEVSRLYQAIATDDPHMWQRILGFHAMADSDYDKGLHSLLPGR